MALINCPECDNKISNKANACPHCGLPKNHFFGEENNNVIGEISPKILYLNFIEKNSELFEKLGRLPKNINSLHFLRELSEDGNNAATTLLGIAYLAGDYVEKNYEKALNLLMASAKHNDPMSHYNIGLMYYLGAGVNQDYLQAFKWIKSSAELGWPEAAAKLGVFYYDGKFVEKNIEESIRLFLYAEKYCHDDELNEVLLNLGLIYYKEEEYKDINKSIILLKKAADYNFSNAQNSLGVLLIENNDSKEMIDDGIKYLECAAHQGNADAMMNLSELYRENKYIERDYVASCLWLLRSNVDDDSGKSSMLNYLLKEMSSEETGRLEKLLEEDVKTSG